VLYNKFDVTGSSPPNNPPQHPNSNYNCVVATTGHWRVSQCIEQHLVVCQSDYYIQPQPGMTDWQYDNCWLIIHFIGTRVLLPGRHINRPTYCVTYSQCHFKFWIYCIFGICNYITLWHVGCFISATGLVDQHSPFYYLKSVQKVFWDAIIFSFFQIMTSHYLEVFFKSQNCYIYRNNIDG